VYVKPGTLKFRVLEAELDELEVDIKRGDYIGVQIDETTMIYFVDGVAVDKTVGSVSEATIREKIDAMISKKSESNGETK
jgi:hypothetical protein